MAYVPRTPPADPARVPEYLAEELRRMSQEIQGKQYLLYPAKLNVAVPRPREGMVAYADGTNWAPDLGEEGLHRHDGTDWIFIERHRVEVNEQTGTTYTLALSDAFDIVLMNNASANTLTVPPNSSVAFPVGTQIIVIQKGAGATTIAQGSGVTVNTPETLVLEKQHAAVTLLKVATDTWYLAGYMDLA